MARKKKFFMVKVNNIQTRRTFKMAGTIEDVFTCMLTQAHPDQKIEMQEEEELVQKATNINKKKVKQKKGPYFKRIHTMKGWTK